MADAPTQLVQLTTSIVQTYLENNQLDNIDQVADLITAVHKALAEAQWEIGEQPSRRLPAAKTQERAAPPPPPLEKAASAPSRALTRIAPEDTFSSDGEFVICLEDMRRMKSLKQYLRKRFNLTPEQYRHKWGLPKDHPIVAPNYRRARQMIGRRVAKKIGLGTVVQKHAAE